MKKNVYWLIGTTLFFVPSTATYYALHKNTTLPTIDFDQSMQTGKFDALLQHQFFAQCYQSFKHLYEHNKPSKVSLSCYPRIPKKMHQIWLGSPFPERYKTWQESWQRLHPDWEYNLWTDRDVATFTFKNKDLFDIATNYGEKSDIWRYEILERYGGVYVDTDFEGIKSLDELIYRYDFFVGMQPLDTNIVQLGIGILGARPHHPLLQQTIKLLRCNKEKKQIIMKTGPLFFSHVCAQWAGTFGYRDIVFPASYFYPLGYQDDKNNYQRYIKSESLAVHHWQGSWLS